MRKINGQYQHLLWLFENVASMPQHYRDTISRCLSYLDRILIPIFSHDIFFKFVIFFRHLDCQPAVIDAKNFSPQLRRRLFWGNIPGLFTVHAEQMTMDGELLTLDKSLMPNSGRSAAQAKIRTLTTNTNSLLQGRTENCKSRKDLASLFPVRFSFQQDELRNADVESDVARHSKKGKRDSTSGINATDKPPRTVLYRYFRFVKSSLSNMWCLRWPMKMTTSRRTYCGSRKLNMFLVCLVILPMWETCPALIVRSFWVTPGRFQSSFLFSPISRVTRFETLRQGRVSLAFKLVDHKFSFNVDFNR